MNQTMNLPRQTMQMEERKAKLSTLWTFLLFNMVFADVFSFMHPGALKQILAGNVDGTTITPEFLLIAAVMTEIPIAMVFLSRFLKYGFNRWVNIIGGVITILWVVGGGSWNLLTYIFIASIEVLCALFIIGYAWRWRNAEPQP